jgi:hypothetical protein
MPNVGYAFEYEARREYLFRKNELLAAEYPIDFKKSKIKVPEALQPKGVTYYDSYVKNSHQYPNLVYCRPYLLGYHPVAIGPIINKQMKNEKFVVGSKLLTRATVPIMAPFVR